MPNKKYTMLLDGEERQVSIDKFEKYGPSMYAERFSGASIRMRNDKGEDYAVPVNDYQRALDSGFRPYVTSYYKDKKEELESHDESVADSVVYLSDSPDPNKPIHVEIPESIRTQYGFTPEGTGPNEQALPDNIRQKADDESLFEENRRRFAEGKPLKGVTTQSIIDANPELGLKRTKQYSEEVLQRSRENVPDYFKSKKDMSLMDLPLGVPGDMLSDEGFNARIDAASKYYQSDSFKDRVKKETGERVEDLYSQTRADLKSIEERISNRESALRNENWRPGMPSTRDDGNLAELRGQRTILSTAENILEDSRKIVKEAGKKDSPWYAALGRGVKDKVFDVDAWTMGISDMAGSMNLNKTLEKADKGEDLTPAEQRLLDAAVTNMAVNAYYSSDLSAAYKAGQVTGESIPFMLEMAVNPISASGNATAKLLLKYGMKKFGREMAKNVGKTAAAAAGMTATTGIPGVIGGAYDRVNGQVQFGLDDKGKLVYTGRKGGMGAGEAFAKSAASRFLENHSEMVFNAFKGMGDEVWRGVQKVVPEGVDGFIQKAAQTGAGRMIREYGNNELMKEAAKRTQFHGILGEYLEEVYNNLANVPLGEMTMDQALDLDRNIETFLGLAPTSVFFGVLGLGGMAAERANHRLKMNAAFGSMAKVQRDKLAELERLSKMNGNADIRTFIKETMADPDLSKEQKRQEIEYAYDIAVGNAYDEAADEQVRIQEEARSAAQEDGQSVYASGDTAAIRESVVREDVSRSRLEEVLPDAAAIDALLEADDVARAEMLDGLPEEVQERAKDFLRDHDRRQAVEDAIDEAHLPEFEEAEARVQEMTRNGCVTIIPLGRFGDPKHSFGVVINGLDESGNVTTNGGLVMAVPLTNGTNGPDFSSFDSRRAEAITLDSSMERQEMEPDSVIESLLGSYKEDVDKLSQPPIVPGQTYTILDGYGKPVGMQVQGRDEQGNWLVLMEGQKIPLVMPEDTILEMLADAERASVIAEYEADDAAKAKGKAAARESLMGDSFSPEVMALKPQVNEEIKIGGIRAQISEVGPDGITVRYIADNGTVSGAGQIPMEEYYAYKQSLFDSQKDQARKDAAAPDLREESSSVQAEKKDDYKQGSNRDFVSMGMEKAERILGDIYGEKMPRKVAVTAKAYADDVVKAQKAVEKAQEAYDNAPIGREGKAKETLDKAKANYEAVKNEADFWAEMDADIKAAQAEREAMLNPQVDVDMSEQPMTVDEFVAQQLANGNITLTSESYKKETGFGEKERKKFPKMFRKAENGGMTIERAGERLMEIASEEGLSFFDQNDANAGRDALINFLGSVYSWGDVAGYVRNSREAMAKRESDAIRDEMEAFIWNNFHMTPEEYATQREIEAVENPYGNVDLAAIDAIFAEKEFESQTLNEETNESGRITEGNQGESGILSEEQVGDNGGNQPSEEERETEGAGNGTQDESEAAQAAELTQKEGESVLDFVERVAEENRRRPLRERANEWSKSLGVKAIFLESIDEVDARTRAMIEASHVEGAAVPGWVAKNGEVFFFMPDLRDMKDIDETYIHEVVAHIGMERLLGKERFAELCDKVWDMMPQAEKNYYFYQYPGVKEIKNAGERKRRAADEYIAHLAEKQNLTPEEKTIWDNIVKAVRELLDKALNKILSKSRITDADIESLVRASYANMKKDARVDVSQKLEQARSEVNQKPTEKQKEAGNYKKGHIRIDGFDVTIENPKGSVRSGTDKGGKKWSILMNNDYGYIRGTEAVDGDHIDVFLSDSPIEGNVFVVDQKNEDGSFDESKVMYGFGSMEEARTAYLSNYSEGWESRIMAITEVSKEEFKKWIASSRRKTKAFSEYKNIKTVPSIEETNVSRMADIEARILEIEGRRNEISDELAETPDYDALKVAELRVEEWGLDQEQSELEAEYSGLRSMNDESNAILENEGSDLRFSAKKKRALETVSTSRKKHQQTVISSADGAKILNNLDNLAEKYENDTHTKEKTFIGEVAKAIEARKQGSGSQYATFETVNGNVVTIRLADHNVTVSNFDNRGENEGISIVVSAKDNNGITNDGAAHIVEYFYDSIDLRRADGKPLAEIVKSIKQSLYSGEYKDTTGLAERQEVNESRFRVVRDKNGKKTLVGLHNISESKLKKAIKQGGLANPSMAVIDLDKQSHVDYGDITLIAPESLVDKKSGRNIGTYMADAWTPIYPNIEKQMSDKGAEIYSKSLESIPSELRNKVRLYFNTYLEDGNTSGALNYWFLHDTGKNPPLLTSQSNDYTNEELDAIEAISNAGYYYGLNEEEKQKVLDLFIEKQGGKDAFDAKIAERIKTMKNNLQRSDLKAFMKNKVEQKLQEIQEYGYDYEQVSNFYSNAQRVINNRGKIDEFRTFRNAQDVVNNEGLQGEFNEWLADKEEQFGVEEYLFVGYNNNGDRKYLPNTLENASKLMKKEGRAGATGLHGFNHFVATLAPNAGTLAQINKKKGNLSTQEEYDAFRERWGDVYHELAKQLQPDATGYADYGYYRLEEMPTVKNPKEYVKKEYGIELSDEFMKKYNEFVSAIKNDFPARYFETKFERPVYLNEFAAAVVPQGTSKDVVDALTEAGLPVEEYESGNNEARMAAVDKVSSEMEGVRFRVTFSKEEQSIIDKAKTNGTYMKAPNGKPTNLTEKQWAQVRTKAFKKWFGDWENDAANASKVVDENGEPLVMYHGTNADFTEFDINKFGKTDSGSYGRAFYFTARPERAKRYGKNVMPVFVNARNLIDGRKNEALGYVFGSPTVEDARQRLYDPTDDAMTQKEKDMAAEMITEELVEEAKKYDGVDGSTSRVRFDELTVANPTQIKSAADNVGTFDEGSNDIRFRTVYHGSAADFDKFDRNFSGSGEGQAVMGAGHYVTTSEGTGRYYAEVASDMRRKVIQEGGYTYNGKVIRSRAVVDAYEALKKNDFDVDKAIESIEHRIAVIRRVKGDNANTTNAEEAIKLLREEKDSKNTLGYQEEIIEKPARHLYEVEIPDDNGKNYFDLDKKATKKTKDEAKKRLYSALDNSEGAEYWKKNRDIVEDEWRYNVSPSEATNDAVRATMEQFLTQEEVADILSDMGYVGSKSKATDGTTYIIYKDDSLEIKNNTRFRISNNNQEIFVSNAQKAVEGIKQEKATPQQWLAMVEKNGGLKASEDKWLGLSDWLKSSDAKTITKSEILDFIGENKIVIEEVKYEEGDNVGFDEFGGSSYLDGIEREFDNLRVEYGVSDAERKLMENHPGIEEFAFVENGYLEWDYDEAEIAEWINKDARVKSKVSPINSTRLEYTTKGLENKQEIALVVPTIESWNEDDEIHFGDAGEGRAVAWIRFGETVAPKAEYEKEAREADKALTEYQNELADKYMEDGGSGDPTEYLDMMTEDEIKHMRELSGRMIDTREAADNNVDRILVIDEIQSKRHQEGREKGYKSQADKTPAKMEDLIFGEYNGLITATYKGERLFFSKWKSKEEILEMINERIADGQLGSANNLIPDAPFKKNWSELAFKRMLRYAAENGFDKVAWTTGAQQAERYDIGTKISKAKVSVDEDGSRLVTLDFRNDEGYLDFYQMRVDSKGVVTSGDYSGNILADVVGKEFALKVMGVEKSETFTGDGLVVGGEGMKGFYDKMLRSFVQKYTKKWGAKVQDIELPNVEEAGRIMHSVDITDAMKEDVMEGQVMFRITPKGKAIQSEVDKFTAKYESAPVVVLESEMTDEEIDALVPGATNAMLQEELKKGAQGGYNVGLDKIIIFADNLPMEELEDTLFHENLHSMRFGKDMVDSFWASSEGKFTKAKEAIEDAYEEDMRAEELFVFVAAHAMDTGDFKNIEKYLPENYKEEFYNRIKEFGYDKEQENKRRGNSRQGVGEKSQEIRTSRSGGEGVAENTPREESQREQARRLKELFDQVADNGFRGVVGDKAYESAMFEMYRSLPMEARKRVAMDALNNHGADMGKAMDKFIGESYNTSLWDVVVGAIRNMLRKKGYDIRFSENDIRYLVWRNRQKLNPYSIIDKAEDINKRVVLGTGDRSDKPDGIRFREKRPLIVRRYDEAVDNGSFRFQEAFQDSMLSLKVLMEIIEQETGKKAKTFENAYTAENRLSSVNKVDNEKYIEEFFTPLMSVIKRLSDKFGQKSVEDYIYAKSGLERNEVLKKRDADKAYAEALEDLDEKLRKGELSDDQYDALKSNAEIARSEAMSSEDDYAGLRGLLFNSKAHELDERLRKGEITESDYNRLYNELESKEDEVEKDFKSFAETIVNDFESSAGRKDVDDLWDKINAATNETLRKDYESGMIDKETYEATRDMMEYYVPLRGWSEKTAEDVYDYHHTTAPIQKNQKTAKGRRSQADNPITSIAQMAQNAIVRGNRNKMKQRLFNFVVNRPTALATFQEGWYVKNNASGDFELEYPVIEEGDTAEDIQKKMDEFERRMEELSKDRQAFKGKLPFGSPYRIQSKQKNEHIVPVMINGREYGIYINGNPRAAQAVNGMTNPEASNMLSEMYESAKRFYSAGLTSWNPDFLMANAVRDGIHSTVMTLLDKGPLASAYFLRDIPKCIKTIRAEIFGNGSSDPQMHRYFDEFVNFGGETGYTAVHTLEDYKKEYEKMLRNLDGLEKGAQFAKEGFSSIAKWMEQANRMFEDISRFNAYQSARKSGRSVEESVDAAKNITVNFNKKGALGTTKGFWGSLAWFMNKWILFFNPTVQGITQIYKSAKKNPKRFNVLLGTILGSGVIVPFLNSMVVGLLGGDEEDYWLQNDYNRMNNLLLKNPAGEGYFKVPLPPTFREIYGMGDIFYRLMTGRISPERASVATLRQLQLLTGFLNVIPDDEPDLGKALIGLAPDVLAPLTDIVVNQDFTGRKIAKITDYNKYSPEYQRVYKGVSPFYVEISRYINKIGGDDVSRAPLYGTFINPAYMEHIITGYTGGIGKTLSNVSGIVADAVSGNFDENFDLRKIPVASRFYSVSDESTVRSAVNRKFREYQSRFEKISYDYKKYSEAVRSGKTEFSVEIERMDNNGGKAFVDYFRKKQKSLNKKLDRLKNNPEDKTLEQEITDLKAEIALKCYELLK